MYSIKTQLASKLIEIDFIKYVRELFIELQLSYLDFKQMLVFHFSPGGCLFCTTQRRVHEGEGDFNWKANVGCSSKWESKSVFCVVSLSTLDRKGNFRILSVI